MDGVLLGAFILGLPANEIVLPIAIIGYTSMGVGEAMALGGVGEVLLRAGFTPVKAISTIIFSLMHWPCSTSLITVYKETKSRKMTLLAFLLPTVIGFLLCATVGFFG
jgi:ferrous iron transport protein B